MQPTPEGYTNNRTLLGVQLRGDGDPSLALGMTWQLGGYGGQKWRFE